jgi:putative membrane protein
MRLFNLSFAIVLAVGGWSGCSKDGAGEAQPGASQGSEVPPVPLTGTVPMTKLTDGQIAQVLATVDAAEIEQGQLALSKSSNPGVRDYASHMVAQHTASRDAGARLASQSGLGLAESPKASELQAAGTQMLERLNTADAASFDTTYIQGQAEQHAEVLTMIDDQLQPAVNDAALRDHLTQARAMVKEHLDRAKQLQP